MGESNANPFAMHDIATKIRDCILPYLEGTAAGLPDRACVTAGEIAWDDCECGQLAVSMVNKNAIDEVNQPRSTATSPGHRRCGPPSMQMNFLVSMLRCAPNGGDNGDGTFAPPTCDQLSAAARISAEDAWAVMAGIVCCLNAAITERLPNGTRLYRDFTVGTQTFVGPNGGCMGSEVPVSVVIDNGCYPCDIS